MPALRTKEQEIEDYVDIYIKAYDNRKNVKKKLKESYPSNESDVKYGLNYFDSQIKKKGEMNSEDTIKQNFAYLVVAMALGAFLILVYFVFFQATIFTENSCSEEPISIAFHGSGFFREKINERIAEIMENDCESFGLIADNVKSIEFMDGINGIIDDKRKRILVGSYGNEDFWYTTVFVKGACIFDYLENHADVNRLQMDLECWEQAALAAERVHENEELARYLREKNPSNNWKEFRLYENG